MQKPLNIRFTRKILEKVCLDTLPREGGRGDTAMPHTRVKKGIASHGVACLMALLWLGLVTDLHYSWRLTVQEGRHISLVECPRGRSAIATSLLTTQTGTR